MRRILGQALVAGLAVLRQVLDHMKWVFDLRPHARLDLLELLGKHRPAAALGQALTLARSHGDVPGGVGRSLGHLLTPVRALIIGIGKHGLLLPVQQFMRMSDIRFIGGSAHAVCYLPRVGIHPHMRLHAEVPLVAFLGLMHLRVAYARLVLGRGRRRNDRGIDHRALLEHEPLLGQLGVDRLEDGLGELVFLQQMPEGEQRGGIRRRVLQQVHADEVANGLAVVDGFLHRLVTQAKAVLRDIHAQHALQADRGAPPLALGVVRLDERDELGPGRDRFDLGQKAVAAGLFALGGVLKFGEAQLALHGVEYEGR